MPDRSKATRDFQKERVYQAEHRLRGLFDTAVQIDNREVELDGIRLTLPPEAKFASLESIQSYVDKVIGTGVVAVRERRSAQFAHYEPWRKIIAVPDAKWAMREIVLLHELAHYVTHTEHMGMAAHGPEFVYQFSELLGSVMGAEVALAYRILCGHAGVKFTVAS